MAELLDTSMPSHLVKNGVKALRTLDLKPRSAVDLYMLEEFPEFDPLSECANWFIKNVKEKHYPDRKIDFDFVIQIYNGQFIGDTDVHLDNSGYDQNKYGNSTIITAISSSLLRKSGIVIFIDDFEIDDHTPAKKSDVRYLKRRHRSVQAKDGQLMKFDPVNQYHAAPYLPTDVNRFRLRARPLN
jgi:hypothetical protein